MLDQLSLPIVQAPMAGGLSTPALVAAVSEAGGLGFLAAGLTTPERLRDDLAAVRRETERPFGVNLFSPSPGPGDPDAIAAYAERILPIADALGVSLGEPRFDRDAYDEKLEIICADLETHRREVAVSFVFGCPPAQVIERLQGLGAYVWITVTQVDEAIAAVEAGADAVIAQGSEAGGHRGAWVDDDRPQVPLLELLEGIVDAVGPDVPVVAAGALMNGEQVAQVLAAGAVAAQLGTAFLLTPEAGTSTAHRRALLEDRPTAITRAFSGRRGRGLVNAWLEAVGDDVPSAYPELVHLTAPLRSKSLRSDDPEHFNLWAGERHTEARELPAADLVRELAEELASVGGA